MLTLANIRHAQQILNGTSRETDLLYSPYLSRTNNCEVYLKAENLQVTGSFKLRGAYYKISQLSEEEREKGVIACSAGNHAQGVALAAQKNGISATIYVPSVAPISKVEATKSYGANVVLVDGIYDDAQKEALSAVERTGATLIHPYDDLDVIAGQGTIALELLSQLPDLDAVIVPIGGGGLISGIAFTIKSINPRCKVYGVQAAGAASMVASQVDNKLTPLSRVSTFADGIAVKKPGSITFEMCQQYVDGFATVTDDEIATAILTLIEQHKLISEGAGAVAVASVMFDKFPIEGQRVACLVSGGNIDVTILSKVIQRGLLTAGRVSDLVIEMLDKPGQLKEIATIVADLGANVVHVNHNHGGENTNINDCYLSLALETRNHQHIEEIREAISKAGYKILDTTL
ncbi:MAG: threonine ammonia-lyase [Clostridia bacterium]|nr:threonine ammonia-lyase [Clostridia bacterium]